MGGNLLKTWNLPEKRIPTDEYEIMKHKLINKFHSDMKVNRPCFNRVAVAPSLRNKDTHGDLDILVQCYSDPSILISWKDYKDFSEYLEKEFGYKPYKNSNVYSFPYQSFQVDVTFYPEDEFESSYNYCSWGDTSNLMGRVFHKMGLHFGHSGLSFWIRQGLVDNNLQWSDSDHIYEKVVLTRDMKEICKIGGFDYDVWKRGFDTEEDAFDFVIDSKYFNKELFLLENLNHINRTRNRKRGMYMRFVEYVSDSNKVGEPFRSKHEYSLIMQCKYPQLQRTVDGFRLLYEVSKVIKEKVNGKLVMEWFNLTEKDGKLVGNIMKEIKNIPKYNLLELSQNEIQKKVLDIFTKLSGTKE